MRWSGVLWGFRLVFLLVLGALSFGFGMKLLEYAEKAEITPLFAGIPVSLWLMCYVFQSIIDNGLRVYV